MFSDRIVSYLMKRFRGRALEISPQLSSTAVLTNLFLKGFVSSLCAVFW